MGLYFRIFRHNTGPSYQTAATIVDDFWLMESEHLYYYWQYWCLIHDVENDENSDYYYMESRLAVRFDIEAPQKIKNLKRTYERLYDK
jgi:hypothetical protein